MMHYPLIALEARFIRAYIGIADENLGQNQPDGSIRWGGFEAVYIKKVDSLTETNGISFHCPLCFEKNNGQLGDLGNHTVYIYFAGRDAPDSVGKNKKGETVRWTIVNGTGLTDLELTPSILIETGCGWHGFIGTSGVPAGHAG